MVFLLTYKDGRTALVFNTSAYAASAINVVGLGTMISNIISLLDAESNSRLSLRLICIANGLYGRDGGTFDDDIKNDPARQGYGVVNIKIKFPTKEWKIKITNAGDADDHYVEVDKMKYAALQTKSTKQS